MTQTVVGLFKTLSDANQTIKALKKLGFDDSEISVMAREALMQDLEIEENLESEEVTDGAIIGTAGGAVTGMFAGLIAGMSAIVVPGVGPIVGSGILLTVLGSTAAGAGIGAIAGGALLGGMVKLGVAEEDTQLYAEAVKRGGILIAVQVDSNQAEAVEQIMQQANSLDATTLRSTWQKEGWTGFDETKEPDETYPTL